MSYIEIFDDKISAENIHDIFVRVAGLSYTHGEQDNPDTPPTGVVAELGLDLSKQKVVKDMYDLYMSLCPASDSYNILQRAYVNLFAPGEQPYYHIDGDCMTMLYYVNPIWHPNQGGETKILQSSDRDVFAISPVPGRIAIFNGSLKHTATSFRNMHRFSVALKFIKK